MYNKIIPVIKSINSNTISLIYLRVLKIFLKNESGIFKDIWIINLFITIIILSINDFIVNKIYNLIEENLYKYKDKQSIEIVKISISIFTAIFIKVIFIWLLFNIIKLFVKNSHDGRYDNTWIFNWVYFRSGWISILTVTYYTLIIHPLLKDNILSRSFDIAMKKAVLIYSSDFIDSSKVQTLGSDLILSIISSYFNQILNQVFLI
jgi:hypothetical protein